MSRKVTNKIKHQVTLLTGMNEAHILVKRLAWIKLYDARQEFLLTLRKSKVTGKKYSDAVVQWDKTNRMPDEGTLIQMANNMKNEIFARQAQEQLA